MELFTDSQSAQSITAKYGLLRRVKHVELRLEVGRSSNNLQRLFSTKSSDAGGHDYGGDSDHSSFLRSCISTQARELDDCSDGRASLRGRDSGADGAALWPVGGSQARMNEWLHELHLVSLSTRQRPGGCVLMRVDLMGWSEGIRGRRGT